MIAHVVWAAVVTYAVWRIALAAERIAAVFAPNRNAGADEPDVIVPEDLIAFALSQSEQWAQEETLQAIRQSYDKWKDWNRVRASFGIGSM